MNKQLNSYDLSRKWFDFCFLNPDKIKPNHTALYFFAIEHCNRLGWKQKFGFPTTMVMEAVGIKSYNTYINTLNDVVDWGFIEMIERSKNQYSANIIALSKFDKALDKALDKAFIKHTTKQSESTIQSIDSINKQETINNKQGTKNKMYSKEIHDCFNTCLNYFEEQLHPKDDKIKNNWLDTIDKLNRIDNIPFDKIIEIVKKTREDSFWSSNFLALTKLRKKNDDDIMYIIVFNEQIKSKNNGTTKSRRQLWDEQIAARDNRN